MKIINKNKILNKEPRRVKWTRYEELCSEVYDFVFQLLDNEPDFDGYEAGEIASEIENRFRDEVSSFQDEK